MANLSKFTTSKQSALLTQLSGSKKFQAAVDLAMRKKVGQRTAEDISRYYKSAVSNVGDYVAADGGVGDGERSVSQIAITDPEGTTRRAILPTPWQPLTEQYREYKERTGSTAGYWHFLGLVADDFMARVRSAAAKPVTYTSRVTTSEGKLRVNFKFNLPSLPAPYDRLIRRSFLQGVSGEKVEYVDPLSVGAVSDADRSPPNRVLLPESRRPLIVPIANRMGQLLAQFFKRRF